MSPLHRSLLVAVLTVSVTACQTTDPYTGEQKVSDATKGGGIGAVAGAAVGALIDGRRGALIGAGIGALGGSAIGNYQDQQEAELRRELAATGVSVKRDGNNLFLEMPGDITFATGSADLSARFEPVLASISKVVSKYERTYVDVIGFTDSTGSDSFNEQLSRQRSESVANYLSQRGGVMAERIITEGRGENQPVATNTTSDGRAMNRRVEIKLEPVT